VGLSFSRSVRFGAVRFNFSGSDIGMSVGIPGLRIGTGPRGAYITGSVAGFSYRQSLENDRQNHPKQPTLPNPQSGEVVSIDLNVLDTIAHENKNVLELQDSDGDTLLKSINAQRSKLSLWPFVGGTFLLTFCCLVRISDNWPPFIHPAVFFVFLTITGWVYWRDKIQKLTVLFYETDQATSDLFLRLCDALRESASVRKVKSIATTSRYADTKYTAGASKGLRFGDANLALGNPPGVVANIAVPVLNAGRTILAFYPDRALAFQGSAVGAISYANLSAESLMVRYVEAESVPSDARIIDRTWQYVNKKGGPDRRFKNNRELPICAYNQLNLSTADGLDLRFVGSKEGGFAGLVSALSMMRQ
jgi:hypothetical protein